MHAKTLCALLALGLSMVPAADAHASDGQGDGQGDGQMHCPPILNEDGSIHQHCCPSDVVCPLVTDPHLLPTPGTGTDAPEAAETTPCEPLLVDGKPNKECICPLPVPDLLGICDPL